MTREQEVAALLRADAALVTLLPGGIYAAGDLGQAGITDPTTTPGAYQGGRLRPCAVVHARAPVPTLALVSLRDGHASASQVLEVYVYAREDASVLHEAQERVYTLLQGTPLKGTWPATWTNGLGPLPVPELADARMIRTDYQIVNIRRAAPA